MPYKIYKHTQPALNKNNEDYESVSTLSSNLRYKSYETNINQNEKNALHKLRLENPVRIIIPHFDINSIRNKFYCLTVSYSLTDITFSYNK